MPTAIFSDLFWSDDECRPGSKGGSPTGHDILENYLRKHTLTDKTGMKFILDSAQIFITAFNSNGKQIWKTDPWLDNGLKDYKVREKRPIIVGFAFGENDLFYNNRFELLALELFEKMYLYGKIALRLIIAHHPYREVIWIEFNNTYFGVVDKQTGQYTHGGNN